MSNPRFADVTGVILVGGKSRRMGRDKAFLPWQGRPLFEAILAVFRDSFDQVLLVGDDGGRFGAYDVPVLPDLYPGSALGGLYTGLYHARTDYVFAGPCDMPFPSRELLRHLCTVKEGYDAVVPQKHDALETLFTLYGKGCLAPMRQLLESGNFRIYDLYPMVRTRYICGEELERAGGTGKSLVSVNTPEEAAQSLRS
ncbi:molybdenum cofactor guanylyltransferase [Geomesophilobacter sediminis]|uniref:Probable molybdenum cofactor guanylyltransferase n=1 Tax=Geomesophilobacter sediminis TaxID=2798584 RepID=A0A8J7JDN5_9BACT|nr:molybdenum cofactor guanylyltransferase [Geomesophilobacter sediminis]MBJ6725303.1 molybdenum cofactor guanylyltransferase [Geomesophilobacter sediminis]